VVLAKIYTVKKTLFTVMQLGGNGVFANARLGAPENVPLRLVCDCGFFCCICPKAPKDMQLARRIRGPVYGVASY
jgi:hypothetical protein